MKKEITLTSQSPNSGRSSSRRKTKGQEFIKKGLHILQNISPKLAAKIIWKFSVTPNHRKFTDNQLKLMEEAQTDTIQYLGCKLKTYKWGNGEKKVLLVHGWNSRVADFRRMIEGLVAEGFTVEGIDMKAHGQSEGKRTALPEFCEVLKSYYLDNGPYHALIGYSLGGLASGVITSELDKDIRPEHLIVIAAPPFVRYFFSDVVQKDVGCNASVYEQMCDLVEAYYGQSIDYFDLRAKTDLLEDQKIMLVYDEDDLTVPFARGSELKRHYPDTDWVHTFKMGHYNIISDEQIIEVIGKTLVEDLVITN